MMTSFLAASLVLSQSFNVQVSPNLRMNDWTQSLMIVGTKTAPSGIAMQISTDGLFMAANSVVPSSTGFGMAANGQEFTLKVLARDDMTQLALVEAQGWTRGQGRVISLCAPHQVASSKLIAVTPTGTISGQLVSKERTGIMQTNRRFVKLWEIRFESGQQMLAGAPVFTVDGRMAAIINATLEPVKAETQNAVQAQNFQSARFGPGGITVSYGLGPTVINRVATGFLSPDRMPQHPTLGVFYKSRNGGGVILEQVVKDGSAAAAGLKPADAILAMNGEEITDAYDFAARLFESSVGEKITLDGLRNQEKFRITVEVMGSMNARKSKPQ